MVVATLVEKRKIDVADAVYFCDARIGKAGHVGFLVLKDKDVVTK